MNTINIIIQNKIACLLDMNSFIVCGNKNYTINFSFDEEWDEYEAKTARFKWGGKCVDVVFTGNQCPAPVILDTKAVKVGVYAGDLYTTTSANIRCISSIRCGKDAPVAPTPEVYDQIMQMINDGMLQGASILYGNIMDGDIGKDYLVSTTSIIGTPREGDLIVNSSGGLFRVEKLYPENYACNVHCLASIKGEKGDKGDKGDAGAIKFITVVSLPTEDINDSAIYLVPIEDSEEENRYTEYVYIDGKWEKLGEISVQVDHSEYVKFTDYATASKTGVVRLGAGLKSAVNGMAVPDMASNEMIDGKTDPYRPIVSKNLDYAVKVGITTNTETLTDEEKTSACDWVGALAKKTGLSQFNQAYVKTTAGNNEMFNIDTGVSANTIVRRNNNGDVIVGSNPSNVLAAVNRNYVDNGFVAKKTTNVYSYLYGYDPQGERVARYTPANGEYTVVQRREGNTFDCGTPTAPDHVVNKAYVDGLIAETEVELILTVSGEAEVFYCTVSNFRKNTPEAYIGAVCDTHGTHIIIGYDRPNDQFIVMNESTKDIFRSSSYSFEY